jgi:hypothetical protein
VSGSRPTVIASSVLVIAALLFAPASMALAQSATMTGELLIGTGDLASSSMPCTHRPQAFTFDVAGTATGPYPGTFTESGTVVLAGTGTPEGRRAVVEFRANFEIVTTDGTVTGTKQLVRAERRAPAGECANLPSGGSEAQFGGFFLCYIAHLPDGAIDTGVATGIQLVRTLVGPGEEEGVVFMESFLSDADNGGGQRTPCNSPRGLGGGDRGDKLASRPA